MPVGIGNQKALNWLIMGYRLVLLVGKDLWPQIGTGVFTGMVKKFWQRAGIGVFTEIESMQTYKLAYCAYCIQFSHFPEYFCDLQKQCLGVIGSNKKNNKNCFFWMV